jgi:hypothetical protein
MEGALAMGDNVLGGVEVLHPKVRDGAALTPFDTVRFCLVGASKQALIALDDRLLIVKHGMMAGATGGVRRTTFDYCDITNVEVNTGWVNGIIEVLTAAYAGGVQKDYWNSGDNNDPFKASNAIPIAKATLTKALPRLEELNGWIRAAKRPMAASPAPPASPPAAGGALAAQIRELHELVTLGALTAEEFEAAKAKLLR